MRVALVHDWLLQPGGAEQVLLAMRELWPKAPIFTLMADSQRYPPEFANANIITSYLDRWPGARKHHRKLLPFMPRAIESLDLGAFDLIISSSHCVAKGVRTTPGQLHICYCHTPVRYAWDMQEEYLADAHMNRGLTGTVARVLLARIREWDRRTASRVDHFVANSSFVAWRIREFYGREATVVHPPVRLPDMRTASQSARGDYFVTASRLVPYKRIDLLIEATRLSGDRLVVFGSGPDAERLSGMRATHVELRGHRPTSEVNETIAGARAFLTAAKEDFGIAPVEALAMGTPVIAFGASGSADIVTPETGLLVDAQTPAAFAAALSQFNQRAHTYQRHALRNHAEKFSKEKFLRALREEVETVIEKQGATRARLG